MPNDAPVRNLEQEVDILLGRAEPEGFLRPIASIEHVRYLDAELARMADHYVWALFQLAKVGDATAIALLAGLGYDLTTAHTIVFPTRKQVMQ